VAIVTMSAPFLHAGQAASKKSGALEKKPGKTGTTVEDKAVAGGPPGKDTIPGGPPESNWITRCSGVTRNGSVDCSMEQTYIKPETRQPIALFSVRIPKETRAPATMIQLPLGLYLPAGVEMQIDQDQVVALPLQMCDTGGCYAGTPLSTELAGRLQMGKTLRLRFENVAREKIDALMPLAGFASAFSTIK
jgi:invasion protein IalB